MDRIRMISSLKADDVEIEITISHPSVLLPIRLKGVASVTQEEKTQRNEPEDHLHQHIKRLTSWENEHLPYYQSRIAKGLFVLLGNANHAVNALTIKQIVLSTGFSERAVRQQLKQFETDGWVTRLRGNPDMRNILIAPTARMIATYQQWLALHAEAGPSTKNAPTAFT